MVRVFYRIILVALFGAGIQSCTSNIHETSSFKDIFDHYRSQSGIVAFSVPPALFGLLMDNVSDSSMNDFTSLLKDLSAFRMIVLENENQFDAKKKEIFDVVYQFTVRNEFNDFFTMRGGQDDLIIKVRDKDNTIQEAVILLGAEDSFTVVNLKGNIRPEYFTRLAESGFLEEFSDFRF